MASENKFVTSLSTKHGGILVSGMFMNAAVSSDGMIVASSDGQSGTRSMTISDVGTNELASDGIIPESFSSMKHDRNSF